MKNEGTLAVVFLGLLALSSSGCARSPEPSQEERSLAAPAARTSLYTDHAGSSSRVERVLDRTGTEALHGETVIARGSAVVTIIEDATLDPLGHLIHAEVSICSADEARPTARAIFDRAQRSARVEARGEVSTVSVPDDAPWAYLPPPDARGRVVSTPVSAWIALRAARGATMVRVITPGARSSYLGPADQITQRTEAGTTAGLGVDGADAGAAFIDEVRIASVGVTLTRG
jgi:hypothetical protein